MKNLLTRTLAGTIYIALIVASLLLQDTWFMLLLMLFTVLGIREMERMARPLCHTPRSLCMWDTITGVVIVGVNMLAAQAMATPANSSMAFLLAAPVVFCLLVRAILQMYTHRGNPILSVATSIASLVYVAGALSLLPYLYYIFGSPKLILAMFIMIWMNDTGAFVVGSLCGKHRLFERLSPKKSWEGFFGGLAFSMGAAVVIGLIDPQWLCGMNICYALGLGATVTVTATWGDLFESMLKRTAGIKDSGHLIPGHGGILDRIDSLLFVAPATLLYMVYFGAV